MALFFVQVCVWKCGLSAGKEEQNEETTPFIYWWPRFSSIYAAETKTTKEAKYFKKYNAIKWIVSVFV